MADSTEAVYVESGELPAFVKLENDYLALRDGHADMVGYSESNSYVHEGFRLVMYYIKTDKEE